jgi:ribosomal protein L7Ae-like RNA K-turn-binding protein
VEAVGADAMESRIRERVQGRVDGLLAAAGRARKVAVGASDSAEAIRRGEARLLVLAEDLSGRVAKDLAAAAEAGGVTTACHGDRDRLGLTMARSLVGSVAILDDGFASAVEQELALLRRLDGVGAPADTKCTSPAGRG